MKNPLPMSEFINVKLSTTNLTLNSTQICMIPSSIMKKGDDSHVTDFFCGQMFNSVVCNGCEF